MTNLLALIAAMAVVVIIAVSVGPRRIDSDVIAAMVIGILLGGAIDRLIPTFVRTGNRAMRHRPSDGR